MQTPRHTPAAVLAATSLTSAVLAWFMAQHSLLGARWEFYWPLIAWVVLWAVGALAACRVPNRRFALGAVMVLAAAVRIAAVTGSTPSISSDLYRYGWDARVQFAGVDPYSYAPKAPQVARLRTPPWFPTPTGCIHIGKRPGCTAIDRGDVRTIYPAVAEAWFDAVSLLTPGKAGSRPFQLAGATVDELTIALIAFGLNRSGRNPRDAAWYALCPLPVIEFAANGHVDGFALLLMVAALLALQQGRRAACGAIVGAATMVKLYPAAALVACWRRGRSRMLVGALAVVVASEAPHVIAAGTRILGYLPGYLKEEHYETGGRFLLVGLLPLPSAADTALAAIVVVAACAWVLRSGSRPAVGLAIVLGTLIFVTTPVQPWYAVAVGGIGALAGAPELLLAALAGEPYYAAVVLDTPHQVAVGRLSYATALVAVVAVTRRRARRARVPESARPGQLQSL